MSISNFGTAVAGSLASSSLAQRQGAAERAGQDASSHDRTVESKEKAGKAEGVGSNDDEAEFSRDRDGDGRQAWVWQMNNPEKDEKPRDKSIDPTHQAGNTLDLSG